MKTVLPTKKFGHVINLESDLHFLNAIDNEEKACTVMILIHEGILADIDYYIIINRFCIECFIF